MSLSTGDTLTYTKLALCTGARARRLPHTRGGSSRNSLPAYRCRRRVDPCRRHTGPEVVIVGGGYIGLETAASLCSLGMNVTVPRQLSVYRMVTAPEVSVF